MDTKVLSLTNKSTLEFALLKTKLNIPHTRLSVVSRPRLLKELDEGFSKKLTVIAAPAGYGKSTLAGEWANKGGGPVSWVSLDSGDNDPYRFWSYITASLEQVSPDMLSRVKSTLHLINQAPEALITILVNDLCNVSQDFCLVLDNYHSIINDFIHNSLYFLIKYMPSSMHILIIGRTKPPFSLSRFLINQDLKILSFKELKFNTDEISKFFKQKDVHLSVEDINKFAVSTEGWPAGMQLAAYSLHNNQNKPGNMVNLNGNDYHISSYFAEEALNIWPEDIKTFLLQTSVLEQLTWKLCNAVTGRTDSQDVLQKLAENSSFLIALDYEEKWFRYHHLFLAFLRARLSAEKKYNIAILHRLAGEWYENNGCIPQAIDHFFKSNDYIRCSYLIKNYWLQFLKVRGMKTLLELFEALPATIIEKNVEFIVLHAWTWVLSDDQPFLYRMNMANKRLDKAEELCREESKNNLPETERCRLLGEIALARAKTSSPNIREMAAYIREAYHNLPGGSALVRPEIQINLGLPMLLRTRYLQQNAAELQQAVSCVRDMQLMLDKIAGGSLVGWSSGVYGELAYEFNHLEEATRLLLRSIREAERAGEIGIVIPGLLNLARIKRARGMVQEAFELTAAAEKQARENKLLFWLPVIDSLRARICMETGYKEYIYQWKKTYHFDIYDNLSENIEFQLITLARVLIFEGNLDRALFLLERLLDFAEDEKRMLSKIEILNLQAIVYHEKGKIEKAVKVLKRSLAIGEKDGCMRSFIDEGRAMADLFDSYAVQQDKTNQSSEDRDSFPYVRDLINLTRDFVSTINLVSGEKDSQTTEMLTEREIEVLQLLAEGLNNREVAQRLILSQNTVKSHIANIYSKLMVNNRAQAIQKGREMGII
ncbi:MAG: LuxR C-terminal-related transcriptional regulator [Clostridiales bacterium]|nr:LuxR C-terminal-related transcriptional regulator [Clostridiales bacterium]MCF8022338.1 LuxR C-terminal-related transcriptional regulator [Clostridiales bacterium]